MYQNDSKNTPQLYTVKTGDLGWGRTHSANKSYIFASVVREIHRQPTATLLFTVVLCVLLRY